MYLLATRKKKISITNVMMYYNDVVGCSSSDVTTGALQVFYCLQFVVVALIVDWDGLPV